MATSSSAIMKRCCNCKSDLQPNSSSVQCEKCQKNEAKYGKPTICKYCQLPAAFNEQKCVYCCYSERKHGQPIPCVSCKVRSAFSRNPKKPALCRLCIIHARSQDKHELNGIPIPRQREKEKEKSDRHREEKERHRQSVGAGAHKRKGEHTTAPEATSSKYARSESVSASFVPAQTAQQVQSLQEKVDELSRQLSIKDKLLLEKDRKLAQMQADMSSKERKFREQISQLTKEKEEALFQVHARYREASKQERLDRERAAQRERERKERDRKLKREKDAKKADELAAKAAKQKESESSAPAKTEEKEEEDKENSVKPEETDPIKTDETASPSVDTPEKERFQPESAADEAEVPAKAESEDMDTSQPAKGDTTTNAEAREDDTDSNASD